MVFWKVLILDQYLPLYKCSHLVTLLSSSAVPAAIVYFSLKIDKKNTRVLNLSNMAYFSVFLSDTFRKLLFLDLNTRGASHLALAQQGACCLSISLWCLKLPWRLNKYSCPREVLGPQYFIYTVCYPKERKKTMMQKMFIIVIAVMRSDPERQTDTNN